MTNWKMSKNNDAAWDRAANSARIREEAIRRDSYFPKDSFFKEGEYAIWVRLRNHLHEELRKAVLIRESNLYKAMKEMIEESYKPADGKELPEVVIKNVTRSIIKPLIVYHLIPADMMADNDDEKLKVLKSHFKPSAGEYMFGARKCNWTVANDWVRFWYALTYQAYSGRTSLDYMVRNRALTDSLQRAHQDGTVREAIIKALKSDGRTKLADLVLEEEDFDRLVAARKSEKTMIEMLACEMNHDMRDLQKYSAISTELGKIDTKEQLHLIKGSTVSEVHKSIDENAGKGLLDKETAEDLKLYFDNKDKVRAFRSYMKDPEWSKRVRYVTLECEFLESLAADEKFLGTWIECVYLRANSDQTKVTQDLEAKLNKLYGTFAQSLRAPEIQAYMTEEEKKKVGKAS